MIEDESSRHQRNLEEERMRDIAKEVALEVLENVMRDADHWGLTSFGQLIEFIEEKRREI